MNESPTVEDFLAHYGVKGMRWGHRKAQPRSSTVTVNATPGKKATASGGHDLPPSHDAIRAVTLGQRAKASSTHSLSNQELRDLVDRMNLEQQYSRLSSGNISSGQKIFDKNIKPLLQQEAQKFIQKQLVPRIVTEVTNRITKN